MKNPSKKQDAEGNWYGRAASNVRSFRHYAWFDWAAIGFARDHLWAGLALPDEIKYNQYIPHQTRRKKNMLSRATSILKAITEKRIVGLSVGADAILVMQRCAKGHSPVQLQGGGGRRKICIPSRGARCISSRGRAEEVSPGYTHGLEWPAGACRAAGLESDRRAPVDYLSRRQGVEPLLPRGAPLPEQMAPVPPSAQAGDDALRLPAVQADERKGDKVAGVRPKGSSPWPAQMAGGATTARPGASGRCDILPSRCCSSPFAMARIRCPGSGSG